MATIVDQVRRAKHWVLAHIGEWGGDPDQLTISGHSAGAHLATFLFAAAERPSKVRAAALLGGIYDLAPLQRCFLEPLIGLTDEEVAAFTPMSRRHDPSTKVTLLVGERETPPFHRQASDFALRLRAQGLSVTESRLEDRNHMDGVRDLGLRGTQAGDRLMETIATARS